MSDELAAVRAEVQHLMQFIAALSHGLEECVNVPERRLLPANGLAFNAGQRLGREFCEEAGSATHLIQAVEIVKDVLHSRGFRWEFEVWKEEEGVKTRVVVNGAGRERAEKYIRLVFRDCMIRQSLFCYGHPQKGSLCYMMYGFFSGATERIIGKRCRLEVLDCGPNACLKELILEED